MIAAALSLILQASIPPAQQAEHLQLTADAYKNCVSSTARRYATNTREPAASIADAALGKCADFEHAVRAALSAMTANGDHSIFTPADLTAQINTLRTTWHERAMAIVMDSRVRVSPNAR